MPRYFFHLRDGDRLIRDRDGVELANIRSARREAILGARDLMCDDIQRGHMTNADRSYQIEDDTGNCVATIPFLDAFRR